MYIRLGGFISDPQRPPLNFKRSRNWTRTLSPCRDSLYSRDQVIHERAHHWWMDFTRVRHSYYRKGPNCSLRDRRGGHESSVDVPPINCRMRSCLNNQESLARTFHFFPHVLTGHGRDSDCCDYFSTQKPQCRSKNYGNDTQLRVASPST